MIILVTGAAGFIGSHLSRALLAQNHIVVGMDNFDAFYSKTVKENNIKDLLLHPKFTFLEVDICQEYSHAFNQLLHYSFDVVVHLAAKAGVLSSVEDIDAYLKSNVLGTKNILELMRKIGCGKMIFASSSSIYGNANEPPFRESGITDRPLTPYASSKKACELLTYNYHHIFNFDVLNLRLFTVYGSAQRPDLVIHKFAKLIHQNQPIRIFGDGNSMRDYTYVSDIVEGFVSAISYISCHTQVYENINLGNNKPIKLAEVVNQLYELMNKTPQIIYEKEQLGDMSVTCADITKAQQILNYQPRVSFQEGVKLFTNWFQAYLLT